MFFAFASFAIGCGDDNDDADDESNGGSAGSITLAGASGRAGASSGAAGTSSGMSGSGAAAPSAGGNGSAGTPGASGAEVGSGGRSAGSAGNGQAGESLAGSGGQGTAPGPGPDGQSVYTIECHGNSLDCNDPTLRCLGIREGNAVFGYSCSNQCQSIDDCSDVDSGAEASVGCVDFVATKHCLLVCKDEQNGDRACPTGMGCYVYPGALIGYCLWQ